MTTPRNRRRDSTHATTSPPGRPLYSGARRPCDSGHGSPSSQEGFVATLLAPLSQDVIGGDAQTLGLTLSAQAVGGIAGSWWAARVADRYDPFSFLGRGAVACGLLLVDDCAAMSRPSNVRPPAPFRPIRHAWTTQNSLPS